MAWIASKFARHAQCIDCAALIRHAHECMDECISLDTILHGNHTAIQIAEEGMRDQMMRNNPKFLSELSLKDYKIQKNTLFTLK